MGLGGTPDHQGCVPSLMSSVLNKCPGPSGRQQEEKVGLPAPDSHPAGCVTLGQSLPSRLYAYL